MVNRNLEKCVLGKLFLGSVFFFLLCGVFLMSCNDKDETTIIANPLTVTDVEERFDRESNLYVRASFGTLKPDTIASVGFVYTDAVETFASPVLGVDHSITVSSFSLDESGGSNTYYFEGLINPIRISPPNYWYEANIAAYITTVSGKTYMSTAVSLNSDKVILQDVYPRYATAGSSVKATLNRQSYLKKFYVSSFDGGGSGQAYDVSLLMNNQTILIDSMTSTELFFKMPAGLNEDTPIKLRIGEYEVEYEKPLKNTTLNFEYVTKAERDHRSGHFLFSTPGSIYFGGGNDVTDTKLLTDFWKYDVATNAWSRIADYPSTGRSRGMAFTIGENAYCGNPDNFQRYNFSSNTWTTVPLPTNDLKYNHTFSDAASVVHNGAAYFSNFFPPHDRGGVYYGNFWRFNPTTQTYTSLEDVLGITGAFDYSGYMAQAVVFTNQFHFFRNLQHWRYDPQANSWLSLKDINQEGRDIRAFLFKGEMYGIVTTIIPDGYLGSMGKTYTLYKYNLATDSWIRDSDVPRTYIRGDIVSMTVSFNIIQTSDTEVYLCMVNGSGFMFHKIKS